jgi:hypothetical protein
VTEEMYRTLGYALRQRERTTFLCSSTSLPLGSCFLFPKTDAKNLVVSKLKEDERDDIRGLLSN